MLLRVKEESPEEIAGFVLAAREAMALPSPLPKVDLDWSSYAGKRRQLPWFILAALLLARNGMSVFMHGGGGPYGGPRLHQRGSGAPWHSGCGKLRGSRRASRPAEFRLYDARPDQPGAWPADQPAPNSRPALARAHAVAHAQSLRRAGDAAGHLPSRLHGNSPEGGAAARPAAHGASSAAKAARSSGARTSPAKCSRFTMAHWRRSAGPPCFPSRAKPPKRKWTSAACCAVAGRHHG